MDYLLDIQNLCVSYRDKLALRDISLRIPSCSITALIGPSGCGKTTLLRSINRLNEHIPNCKSSGHILLGGVDILSPVDVRALRRTVGMVFQKPNPFPFSVMENMRLPLVLAGIRERAFIRQETRRYLELVGLWEEIEGEADSTNGLELSVGQQQRLCLARALILRPQVLLLDEPCSALDPHSTARVEELLLGLKTRVTILIATHSLAQAKRIADQVVFLLNGRVVEYATVDKIFNRPDNEKTSQYINGLFG